MLPIQIIFVAVFINLVGQLFYIKSVFKGHAKPNMVSWLVWMLAPLMGFTFQIKAGAGLSAVPVFMAGFGPFIVIIAALIKKNALWKITAFDINCGIIAIIALVCYVFTHNLGISISFAILSDMLASIPTIIKSWKFPETESSSAYLGAVIANVIGLLTITTWSFAAYSFGLWLLILNVILVFFIHRKKFCVWYNSLYARK